jgi:hypothetical protein
VAIYQRETSSRQLFAQFFIPSPSLLKRRTIGFLLWRRPSFEMIIAADVIGAQRLSGELDWRETNDAGAGLFQGISPLSRTGLNCARIWPSA